MQITTDQIINKVLDSWIYLECAVTIAAVLNLTSKTPSL